jgi:hypothetical protein
MSLPDDGEIDFDFDELELDETTEETESSEGAESTEGTEAQDELAEGRQESNLSRGQKRIQSLANKSRDSERRAIEAEATNRALQQQLEAMRSQPAQPQYDPRAEQEYLAALDPAERITYQFNRQLQAVQQQNTYQQYTMLDMMDRTMYQSKAANNPVYKQLEADVERMRIAEASKGRHFNREDILAFLIGQKMLNNKKSGKTKTTKKAAQTTRPGNTSTDVASGRSQSSERSARAKRVQSYTF